MHEILLLTIFSGGLNGDTSLFSRSFFMVRAQIGDAPVMPEATEDIEVLSLFPTQVATSKSGV